MRYAYVEQGESLLLNRVRNLPDVGSQLSDACLHGNFPERYHTYHDVVAGVFKQFPRFPPKLAVVGQPPKQGVGVEEKLQPSSPSMAASTSAGSASKSGAIQI